MSEIEDFGGPINRPAQNARQGTPGELENLTSAFGDGATDFLGLNESLPDTAPTPFTPPGAPATEPGVEADSWLLNASPEAPIQVPAPLAPSTAESSTQLLNTTWSEPTPRRRGHWAGLVIGAASLGVLALVGYPALRRSMSPELAPAGVTGSRPVQRSDAVEPLEVVSRRAAVDDLDTPGAVEPAPEIDEPLPELAIERFSASPREPEAVVPTNALEDNGLVEVVDPALATSFVAPGSIEAEPMPRPARRARDERALAQEAARLEQSLVLAAMNAECEPEPTSSATTTPETALTAHAQLSDPASDDASSATPETGLAELGAWETGAETASLEGLEDARVELDTSAETEARRARRAEARAERWKAREAALEAARLEQAELLAEMNADCEQELPAAGTEVAAAEDAEPVDDAASASAPSDEPVVTLDEGVATTLPASEAAPREPDTASVPDTTPETAEAYVAVEEDLTVGEALGEPEPEPAAEAEARRARRAAARAARWKAREAALEAARLEQAEALAAMNSDCEPEAAAQPVAAVQPEPAPAPVVPTTPLAPTLIGAPAPAGLPSDAPACGPTADVATLAAGDTTEPLAPSQCSGNPRTTQLDVQDVLLVHRPRPTARAATQAELKSVWTEPSIPLDSIGRTTKLLTPNVGKVRATLTSGELFEGQLYAVGEGCVWLDTTYGRMGLTGARVKSVVRIEPPKDSKNSSTEGTVVDERVRIRTPGGMLSGRLLEDDGKSATVLTDGGARLTVESSTLERLAEEPRVRVQSREKP